MYMAEKNENGCDKITKSAIQTVFIELLLQILFNLFLYFFLCSKRRKCASNNEGN